MRCFIGRLSDEIAPESSREFKSLIDLTAGLGLIPYPSGSAFDRNQLHHHVMQRVYHAEMPGSVRELLARIRFIASTVRDRFSGDTWRILGRLEVDSRSRPGRLPLANALTVVQNLVLDLAAFNGMEMENMTRGHGWRFLDLGRRIERGQTIVQLLRTTMGLRQGVPVVLEPVLEIADSLMTYRRRYFAEPRLPGVIELLVCDVANPRGLAFQVESLSDHIDALPSPTGATGALVPLHRMEVIRLRQRIHELELDRGSMVSIESLDRLVGHLDFFAKQMALISDSLTGRFFSHTVPRVS
jgi:uncharacterized alpha-E superfamily protein